MRKMWGNSGLTVCLLSMAVALVGEAADGGVVAQSIVQTSPLDI